MNLERSAISLESSAATSESTNNEEDQLLESISRLRAEIDRIESTTGPSKRTQCIRDEIKRLGSRLAECKIQAGKHIDPISKIEPENQ